MTTDVTKAPLDLSLYHLDAGLQQLIEYRRERLTDRESPPDAEELSALDGEIRRYMDAVPQKVSGVVGVLRSWGSKRDAAKAEIARLTRIVDHFENMERDLKSYLADILERQPEPKKGCKKLTGADGSVLMLKGNGGLAPLKITDEAAIPLDCKKATVAMPADEWESFREHMLDIGMTLISERVEIDNAAIRQAIVDTGGVPGAYIAEHGKHVEVR